MTQHYTSSINPGWISPCSLGYQKVIRQFNTSRSSCQSNWIYIWNKRTCVLVGGAYLLTIQSVTCDTTKHRYLIAVVHISESHYLVINDLLFRKRRTLQSTCCKPTHYQLCCLYDFTVYFTLGGFSFSVPQSGSESTVACERMWIHI
jgi:hypothetical protein